MKLMFLQENPLYEALGIQALAGVVRGAGHECDLLIESEEPNFVDKIREAKPDLLAFSFMTRQQEWAINTINRIRKPLGIPVLIGGTHPTMYTETLGHCQADFLCVGEGEGPLIDLCNRIADKGRTDNIPNIHAKVDGSLVKNEIRPLTTDWDQYAMPDTTIYKRYSYLQKLPMKRFITAFGCAFKCSFCYINNYREAYEGKGKFFRRKSIDRVIKEMKDVRSRYPMGRVHFVDDIFSLDNSWVKEFLPVYWKEIGIPWSANIWIDHMKEDVVKMYKEHGCAGVTFGVESGNEETRTKLIDKPLKNDIYIRNCAHLKKYGIRFHTGNIIGLPGEGLEKAFETARFNRLIGTTSTRASLFWPFPNTKLTEYAMDQGMLSSDYSVEYFNRGIYPKVKHEQVDELTILSNFFHLVAKWEWFENLVRFLLRWPTNPVIKYVAKLADQSYWFAEARFFNLLNFSGVRHYFYLRRGLEAMKRHAADPRFAKDAEAHRPFWNMSQSDIDQVYEKNRDGIT